MEKILNTHHGKFLLRPYRIDDEEKVLSLWEAAFNQKMEKKLWRWKYHENPFGYQIMLCLNDKNEAVVMYGGLPYNSIYNEQAIYMTQMTDSMSHPDYRRTTQGRKGLFIQTAEHFFDIFANSNKSIFYYGFPGVRAYRLGNLFLKYYEICNGVQYVSTNINQINVPLTFLNKVSILSHFNKKVFNQIWSSLKEHYPFSIIRDAEFIKWRYFDHPTKKYLIYTSHKIFHQTSAYAIVQINDDTATIVDILAMPDIGIISSLVSKIKSDLLKTKIVKIQSWLPPQHFMTQTLLNLGFLAKKEPLGLTIVGTTFSEKLPLEFVSKNLYFTMGDGDLY